MAATHETFRIPLAANNVGTRAHTPGNNAHLAFASAHGTLAGDENVFTIVVLPSDIVVMATHHRAAWSRFSADPSCLWGARRRICPAERSSAFRGVCPGCELRHEPRR